MSEPICACESEPHSPYGPVAGDEALGRAIISPHHVDPDSGDVLPSALQVRDLMEKGLSLLRLKHLDASEFEVQSTFLTKGKEGRAVVGMLVARADAIRELRDNIGRQALCVIDDEQPGQPMHASAKQSADQQLVEIRGLRLKLMKIFGPIITPAELF